MGKDFSSPAQQAAVKVIRDFPNEPDNANAKRLFHREPRLFTSLNAARMKIRVVRGRAGVDRRKRHRGHTMPKPPGVAKRCQRWGIHWMAPQKNEWKEWTLPDIRGKWLVMSDLHIPNQHIDSVDATVDYGKRHKCGGVLILGDLVDCHAGSFFERDPREKNFDEELNQLENFLTNLRKVFKKPIPIWWRAANHEYRLERYFHEHPQVVSERWTYPVMMELDKRGITWVPHKDPIRHGMLLFEHGDEWGRGAGQSVSPARTAFLRSGVCTVRGHHHYTSSHRFRNAFDTNVGTWSIGCLCDLHPKWLPRNNWNLGFGICDCSVQGWWKFETHDIIDGEVL